MSRIAWTAFAGGSRLFALACVGDPTSPPPPDASALDAAPDTNHASVDGLGNDHVLVATAGK
jgi:hypothetical protein